MQGRGRGMGDGRRGKGYGKVRGIKKRGEGKGEWVTRKWRGKEDTGPNKVSMDNGLTIASA